MPAAIPAIAAAAFAAASGTVVFGLSVALSAVVIGLGTFALNTLSASLAPKPKAMDFGDLSSSRTTQVKQPITERRVVYGECKVSGPINYYGSTSDNKYLHIVITLATHQCNALGTTWFNDEPIHPEYLDSGGNVITGKYAGKARLKKHLGQQGQIVDSDLLAEIAEITSNFVGNEITYLYARLEKDDALYKAGLPNIQQWTQGALVYDPRTATSYWTPNSALCVRDYMTNTRYGVSERASKFPDANVTAVANSCEEFVATKALSHTVTQFPGNNTIQLNTDLLQFQTGDRVQLTTQGSLPSGLSTGTNYYVIVWQQVPETTISDGVKIKLASSYLNALAGTAVAISGSGSGQCTVTKNAEPRYTCNGTLGTAQTPRQNVSDLLTSMAGDLMPLGGKWIMKAGVWVEPTVTITEDDLCGPIERTTKRSRRDRFNAVQGLYVTPVNFGEPGDYPLVKDATYLTEDGGELVIGQFDLPFTSRAQMAQRVGRVKLNQHRRQRSVQLTTDISGLRIASGSTFMLTHSNSRYNQKKFEVSEFNLVPRMDKNQRPILTCDIIATETDSAIYDFDETQQEIQPSPPQTVTRGNPDNVTMPGAPNVTERKYITTDGSGVKVAADVTFAASTDFFVRQYQVEYKLKSASNYELLPPSNSTIVTIFDLTPGDYDIRVKAITIFDAHSEYATGSFTIIGLQDLPGDVQNFSVVSLADDAAFAWDQTVDVDVKVSGWVRIRHTPDLVGYNWSDARDITAALPGIATTANAPLLAGVYMAKFVDSVGNESENPAIIIVENTSTIQKNALATLTEHTAFSGTKTDMVAIDGVLRLDGGALFDSISGSFDSAGGAFDQGGGAGQTLSGIYRFHDVIDCGKVIRAYASTHILLSIYNATDLFDFRDGDFDSATGLFDGADITGISVQFFVRTTDDDPRGVSPTWRAWQPFVAGYFTCRGYQFEIRLTSNNSTLQADIAELSASVDVPDVTDSAKDTTSAGALKTIAYNKTFVAAPDVTAIINDAQAGDQLVIPPADVTSSNFKIGVVNSAAYVARNITWFARGY